MNLMKPWSNQKGLTLVELLGALALVFVLTTGIFAVLINSLNYYQEESDQIDVRTKANTIANQLTTFYQENGGFEIEHMDGEVTIRSGEETRTYAISGHRIEIHQHLPVELGLFLVKEFTIIISGDDNPFILETVVSRLKETA